MLVMHTRASGNQVVRVVPDKFEQLSELLVKKSKFKI